MGRGRGIQACNQGCKGARFHCHRTSYSCWSGTFIILPSVCTLSNHDIQQTPKEANPHPVSSSDVQAPSLGGMTFGKPRPLTTDEIDDVVNRFAFAAKALRDVSSTPT